MLPLTYIGAVVLSRGQSVNQVTVIPPADRTTLVMFVASKPSSKPVLSSGARGPSPWPTRLKYPSRGRCSRAQKNILYTVTPSGLAGRAALIAGRLGRDADRYWRECGNLPSTQELREARRPLARWRCSTLFPSPTVIAATLRIQGYAPCPIRYQAKSLQFQGGRSTVWSRGKDSKLPPDSQTWNRPWGAFVVGDQALRPSHIQSAAPAFKGFEKNADQHWRPMGAGHARLRPSCSDAAFLGRRPFISLLPFTAPLGKLIIP
jgi:hypothetical protein